MSWLSVGVGAGIGFAIGGPIGACIGMWLGSSTDNNITQNTTPDQKNQTLFFVSLFAMLSKMASADGVIVQSEINTVTIFMDTINLDSEDKRTAIKIFNNAKLDNQYSIYDHADQYQKIASMEMRKIIYAALWEVAYSDGSIHTKENDILKKIPNNLGLNSSIYFEFSSKFQQKNKIYKPNIDRHYELLNCDSNDSIAKIKQNYRRAIAEYHPDKIQSKGLPKEFIKFSNEQAKKINEAYNAIKKERQKLN